MTDKDLIAGMWAIVVKHHKANTTPNQMHEILEFVRKNDESVERERTNVAKAALECGHPASLKLHSAETGEPLYCELCDMRSQRNDAVQMEEHYKAELTALRERVARLVGAIEPVAKVHINRTGGNVGIAWRAIGIDGSLPALADGEILYVLRTALESVNSLLEGK